MKESNNLFTMLYHWFNKETMTLWKKIDKDDVLTDIEQVGLEIFKIALKDDNNIKFLSPRSFNKMYIVPKDYLLNKDISIFVVFEYSNSRNSNLTIVNHEYKYPFEMPEKTSAIMKEMFEDKVEEDREKMEKNIMKNILSHTYLKMFDF
jgi:hypothetical protein